MREDSSNSSGGLKELNYPEADKYGPIFTHSSESKEGPIFIGIGFNNKFRSSSSAEDLQSNLDYVSLDKLPMPGFQHPRGWEIYPHTPISSFKDGVEILSYENGRLHFTVDTRFSGIYGHIRDLVVPADAPSPNGTYFLVSKDIHGFIDVYMPLLFSQIV